MTNTELIDSFYKAFKAKDYKTMQSCYAENAIFNDSVFTNLSGEEPGQMWEMLITSGKDLTLEYEISGCQNNEVSAKWIAYYTFSKTGNKVKNTITANFKIKDGKIIEHRDYFDFYAWARQAFGFTGVLLGWTPFFKEKVQTTAMKGLKRFIEKC